MTFPTALGAEFSADRAHRLLLWRVWDTATPPLGFVMLNPSSADETRDDPTTVRNMTRARALGYGGVVQANLYSFRTPSPKALKLAAYPGFAALGSHNGNALRRLADVCLDIVLAWGTHVRGTDGDLVADLLSQRQRPPRLFHLGRNKNGSPKHPLFIATAVPLQEFV